MNGELNAYIESKKENMADDLRRLVEINSVRTAPEAGMPFGAGGARALAEASAILREHGYAPANYDNYAVDADLGGAPELMLLAHMDVVAEGDGWTRDPYRLTREGDLLYGRGTTDDKGPAIACLYAMDACRAVLGTPKTGVRLVLGSGEETGSEDMEHYFSKRPTLRYTLSPDADYPLINIEKGRFAPFFSRPVDAAGDAAVTALSGGGTQNIVPGKASAALRGLPAPAVAETAATVTAETGVAFEVAEADGEVRILAVGQTAHAAAPEKGKNAQTALIRLLNRLPLTPNGLTRALTSLEKLFPCGETDGAAAGVKMRDDASGSLTLNFGVLKLEDGVLTGGIDIRCPVCATEDTVKAAVRAVLAAEGFAFDGDPVQRPAHCVPEDSPLIRTLLRVYEDHTGNAGECLAIGGGTYVHEIEGGVAFGVEFPGRDYRIHGADEYTDLNELALTAQMYADVISALCY